MPGRSTTHASNGCHGASPSRREQYIRDYAARPKDWFMGGVRVHDRLIGFDIRGSTLVTVVRRPLARDGIPREAVDWYDISEVDFGP